MLDKLPFWGQLAAMAAISAAVVGFAHWGWPNVSNMRGEIAEFKVSWEEKDQEIRRGQAIEQRLQEFEREIVSLERTLTDVAQILPRDTETGDLLRWIKNLGDQSNLDLKSFAPGSLEAKEFYKEFPIQMQVVGRYHDLGIFLDRVSKYSRIINVDQLKMNRNQGDRDKTVRANFTATTFVYEELEENEEGLQ